MTDIHGREFLEKDFLQLKEQGLLPDYEINIVTGITDKTCNRCLNSEVNYFARFSHKDKKVTYCRKCIDFGVITDETKLYRIAPTNKIAPQVGELNKDFKLSQLQERASNFSKDILINRQQGIVWAV